MKNLLLISIVSFLFTSCASTSSFNKSSFQKRKYTRGFFFNPKTNVQNKKENSNSISGNIAEIKNSINGSNEIIFKSPETSTIISDTIKVTLKDGSDYSGVKTEETETSISILTESGRSVFLLKSDIENLTVISSTERTTIVKSKVESFATTQINEKQLLKYGTKTGKVITGTPQGIWNSQYHILTPQGDEVSMPKRKVKSITSVKDKRTSLNGFSLAGLIMFWLGLFFTFFAIGIPILFIGGIFSLVGFKKSEKNPTTFNYARAKRIKNLYNGLLIILGSVLILFIGLLFIALS